MKESKKKKLTRLLNFYIAVGIFLWIIAGLLILTPIVPQVWYTLSPQTTENEVSSLVLTVDNDTDLLAQMRTEYLQEKEAEEEAAYQSYLDSLPPLDSSLPSASRIIVSKVGINSEIIEGEDSEEALKEGPWIVNDFGTPSNQFAPVIIASHRWGAIGWSANDRKMKSFYRLPDLKVGDRVKVRWEQRMYEYEIYNATEDTKITDYEADLILYTCKLFYDSPIRIFRYAKRIN